MKITSYSKYLLINANLDYLVAFEYIRNNVLDPVMYEFKVRQSQELETGVFSSTLFLVCEKKQTFFFKKLNIAYIHLF